MPTFTHGKEAVIKVADSGATLRDLSDVLNTATLSRGVETAETSTLGDDDKTYIPGLRDATISVEGMADTTTSGYFDGILGLTTTFEFYPAGEGAGQVKYSGSCILTSFETGAELGGAVTVSGEFQVTGAVTRATV